jgi:hypothetical protein
LFFETLVLIKRDTSLADPIGNDAGKAVSISTVLKMRLLRLAGCMAKKLYTDSCRVTQRTSFSFDMNRVVASRHGRPPALGGSAGLYSHAHMQS